MCPIGILSGILCDSQNSIVSTSSSFVNAKWKINRQFSQKTHQKTINMPVLPYTYIYIYIDSVLTSNIAEENLWLFQKFYEWLVIQLKQ